MGRHRTRAAAAALLAVVTVLPSCSDEPERGSEGEASVEEFCTALEEFRDSVDLADADDIAAYVRALKAAAADIAEVGVPDDMPADAEEGFDLTVSRIEQLADDASEDDVARLGDVSEEEQRKLDALEDYIEEACPDLTEDP